MFIRCVFGKDHAFAGASPVNADIYLIATK
jgi:hypothetical protein